MGDALDSLKSTLERFGEANDAATQFLATRAM